MSEYTKYAIDFEIREYIAGRTDGHTFWCWAVGLLDEYTQRGDYVVVDYLRAQTRELR